jgi:hypothetical protein
MGSSKSRAEARKWRRAAEKELTQELKINAEAPDLFQIREMEDSESQTKFSATSAFSVWLRFCHAQYFAVHDQKSVAKNLVKVLLQTLPFAAWRPKRMTISSSRWASASEA